MTSPPSAPPPQAPARVAWVAAGLAATVLGAHLTMTFLHVAPVNPVKVEHEVLVDRWTRPVFEQNWKLFAPDPIAVDQGVLVRATTDGGARTPFVDIVTPYLLDKHHNLLASRAGYQVTGVLTRFLEAREALVTGLPDDVADSAALFLTEEHLDLADEADRQAYEESLRDLRDSAVAHLDVPAALVTSVQLRVVQHEFPRWSERASTGVGTVSHSTSEWLRLEGGAA